MAGAALPAWNPARSAAGRVNPWAVVAIISLPTFMEVLDTSIANVSLDHIAGGLSVTLDQATWVLTSYLVANAVIIPLSGWLSDVIGRKRYFMISIVLFTLSSLMCGLAGDLTTLIIARVLQGIGGGGLAPVEQSILADTFPPNRRAMAFAAFAIVVVVGPVMGPTLGGLITDAVSWHWIFLINVPVGIVALALTYLFVDEPQAVRDDRAAKLAGGIRVDYVGILLVALGLGLLEYTLDRGDRDEWFASSTLVFTAIVSATSLIALVIWELYHDDPVVDFRLMKSRNFSLTLLVMMTTGMILFGTTQLVPQMLQQVLGYTAFQSGMAMTIAGFATLAMVPFAGRLSTIVDVRWLLFGALLVQSYALWNMSHLTATIGFYDAAIARMYQAAALPFLFVPINAVAYIGLPQTKTAQASSLLNVARNLGGSIGISMSQTLLSTYRQVEQSVTVERLNNGNPNYTEWLEQSARALGQAPGSDTLMGVMYQQVQAQASMLAFLDVFRTLMIVILVIAPTVFLMRAAKADGAPSMGH